LLFTEPTPLFLFLPVLLALYFATFSREHGSYGNLLLLIASVAVYAKGGGGFTWLMLASIALVPKRPRRARVVEPPGADAMAQKGRLVTEIPGSSLPRAVIFRDSFVSRLVPFLSEHFSGAVYLWQNDFDADVIQQERPDVVIQEIVGHHLYTFIPTPALIPN
jgi:hypothetical protein